MANPNPNVPAANEISHAAPRSLSEFQGPPEGESTLEQARRSLQAEEIQTRTQLHQLHARVDRDFKYHPPVGNQAELYVELRERGRTLAHWLVDNVPNGRELHRALSDLEDVVMHANAGIARNG